MPAHALDVASRFPEFVADLFDWVIEPNAATIAHTDLRLDNLFFDHAGRVARHDHRLAAVGALMGALDVSYFIAESLATEDRRVHERALLERYHAGLVAGGVTDYSFEQLYDDYRVSLFTQLSIPVIGSSMDPGNERGRRLFDARSSAPLRSPSTITMRSGFLPV